MNVYINGDKYIPESVPAMTCKPFHVLIKEARKAHRETLEDAAAAIGTTKSNLWTLEQGKQEPRLSTVQNLLNHYGLAFEQIAD